MMNAEPTATIVYSDLNKYWLKLNEMLDQHFVLIVHPDRVNEITSAARDEGYQDRVEVKAYAHIDYDEVFVITVGEQFAQRR